jgi:hypothetical protein
VEAQECGSVTREIAWEVRKSPIRGQLGHVCGPPLAPVPWPDFLGNVCGDCDRRIGHDPTQAAPRAVGSGVATHRRHAFVLAIP